MDYLAPVTNILTTSSKFPDPSMKIWGEHIHQCTDMNNLRYVHNSKGSVVEEYILLDLAYPLAPSALNSNRSFKMTVRDVTV